MEGGIGGCRSRQYRRKDERIVSTLKRRIDGGMVRGKMGERKDAEQTDRVGKWEGGKVNRAPKEEDRKMDG